MAKSELGGGAYFSAAKDKLEFIRTGSRLLDCALGGGWCLGRFANVVGDKSTGKTLLAIEAAANFHKYYASGPIKYRETEAAFDPDYAGALGMPIKDVDFGKQVETVEDWFDDLSETINEMKKTKEPGVYILDSLDALSDKEEMKRDMAEGSYNLTKQKNMGQLFRRLVRDVEKTRLSVIIISQVRDKIGVTFGKKWTRSGGRALDFYASHVVYLAYLGQLHRTIGGVKRPTGVRIKAKVDKNKVGLPFRECEFDIMFGYGIDDVGANLDWLKEVGKLKEVGVTAKNEAELGRIKTDITNLPSQEHRKKALEIAKVTERVWREIDQEFMPTRSKY